jgi:aarF domain-containing kinase
MQTDPNPANYLYDLKKQRLNLLDFGSGRDFSEKFLDGYMNIIYGAFTNDRERILHFSHVLGFLTGEENKEMFNAHYLGVMAVGEPFRFKGGLYDFNNQTITKNIYEIIPTMTKHRLTPPPKEIYALHRKIIGTYLMCIKLGSRVSARKIFEDTHEIWKSNLDN